VLVAGEPEWRMEEERRRCGVPVGQGTWQELVNAAERRGLMAPATR